MRNVFCVAAVASLVLSADCSRAAAPEDVFAGTTKIVLTKDLEKDPAKKTVEIADKAEVAQFLGTIKLVAKEPCACDHVERAAFATPARVVTVSLCDHCFDFDGKTYKMPAEFYELFQAKFK